MAIEIRADRSQKIHYPITDYPVNIRQSALSSFPHYAIISHWHDDVELVLVLSGSMTFTINRIHLSVQEGDGVFINGRQLHRCFSPDCKECIYISVVIHPLLLCSSHYLEEHFIAPLLSNHALPYYLLHHTVDWEQRVLEHIRQMKHYFAKPVGALKIQSLFYDIWYELFRHMQQPAETPCIHNHHLSALKDMIFYIQEHYQSKISLADIAQAGNLGKTSCCAIFQNYINRTPNAYLTDYRLRKGAALLLTSDLTVTEIAYEVGFSGASYFTQAFRKSFDCSPREYRKQAADAELPKSFHLEKF